MTLPAPKVAVNPTCQSCGSATYCGAPSCPSKTLQLAPDGVGMLQENHISVAFLARVSMTNTGHQDTVVIGVAG